MKIRGRWVLVPILVVVNAAAVWGQTGWALDHIVDELWIFAVQLTLSLLFSFAIESIGVYLAMMADAAEEMGLPSGGKRLASYAVGLFSGTLNFSHFLSVSFAAAVAFGFLSAISPFLWGIYASVKRGQPVAPSRRFWHPKRSIALLRYAAWEGIADEDEALRLMRVESVRRTEPAIQAHVSTENAPAFTLEMLTAPAELAEAPVSPAPIGRGPRAKWDAAKVIRMIMDGAPKGEVLSATGISPASYGRLLKVSRILREDPRAVILPEEKVSAEHVSMMRELVGR